MHNEVAINVNIFYHFSLFDNERIVFIGWDHVARYLVGMCSLLYTPKQILDSNMRRKAGFIVRQLMTFCQRT